MKKSIFIALICSASLAMFSCDNAPEVKEGHTHSDGTTHADHDTTKPVQQEFNAADSSSKTADTSAHTHEDGKKHSH
ncbi:MAG TPA: hypothetical protein DHW64_11505 [Chitinophagaceae bacterium]|nr:hypothetical protein [Chitinophagaceae bacterium]